MEYPKKDRFGIDNASTFRPLRIAVLIISDSRTLETDTSGLYLSEALSESGHKCVSRQIIEDDIMAIRSRISSFIRDVEIDVVITSGGTGLTGRDVTPEAVMPLLEKVIDGFSILFHQISFETIGLSTLQSRAFAGLANQTLVFCLPGSTGAVRDGWTKVIGPQLDTRYRPCNFGSLLSKPSD